MSSFIKKNLSGLWGGGSRSRSNSNLSSPPSSPQPGQPPLDPPPSPPLSPPPPLPSLYIRHTVDAADALALEALLLATVLSGIDLDYTFSRSPLTDLGNDEEKALAKGTPSPWMIVGGEGEEESEESTTISGFSNCAAFIRELHLLHNISPSVLARNGACFAPPDLGPLAVPQVMQVLDRHREVS